MSWLDLLNQSERYVHLLSMLEEKLEELERIRQEIAWIVQALLELGVPVNSEIVGDINA